MKIKDTVIKSVGILLASAAGMALTSYADSKRLEKTVEDEVKKQLKKEEES